MGNISMSASLKLPRLNATIRTSKLISIMECWAMMKKFLIGILPLFLLPIDAVKASTTTIEATTEYNYVYYVSDLHLGYCSYRCEEAGLPYYQAYETRKDSGLRRAAISMSIWVDGLDELSKYRDTLNLRNGASASAPFSLYAELYDGLGTRFRFDNWKLDLRFDDTGDITFWDGYGVYDGSGDGWRRLSSINAERNGFDTYDLLRGYLPRPASMSSRKGAWILTEKTQRCYEDIRQVNCALHPDFVAPVPLPASGFLVFLSLAGLIASRSFFRPRARTQHHM